MERIFSKNEGERLDKFLSGDLEGFSRSQIQKRLASGDILVNGERKKASYVLESGDKIYLKDFSKNLNSEICAEDIDLDILYEDGNILVIDKPAGMVVHPGEGGAHRSGTVVNAILNRVKDEFDENRPGIVHRLDKDTSGLLLIARNRKVYEHFVGQFKKRAVKKKYLALVCGILEYKEGVIDSPIGRNLRDRKKMGLVSGGKGKEAVSIYKVIEEYEFDRNKFSLVEVGIKTGRTHQIRVHMAGIGHSVVGDKVYGNRGVNKLFREKLGLDRQFLHASNLSFISMDGSIMTFESKMPSLLEGIIFSLEKL